MNARTLVRYLIEDTGMFVSAVLTPESRRKLLQRVPPAHLNVYAHHMTMAHNPDAKTLAYYQKMEGQRIPLAVVAMATDEQGQAVLVGGESENDHPHITISCAEGVSPVYSNELLANSDLDHVLLFTVEADVIIEPLGSD
jgi:hypothetical protein